MPNIEFIQNYKKQEKQKREFINKLAKDKIRSYQNMWKEVNSYL